MISKLVSPFFLSSSLATANSLQIEKLLKVNSSIVIWE